MLKLEDLHEQAPIVREAGELMARMTAERRRKFQRVFDAAGWDADKMRGALAAGYLGMPERVRQEIGTPIALDAGNVPLYPEHLELFAR